MLMMSYFHDQQLARAAGHVIRSASPLPLVFPEREAHKVK